MSIQPAANPVLCPAAETLEKLLRDQLDPTEVSPLEEHIGACPDCQRKLNHLVGSLPDALRPCTRTPNGAADEEPPTLPGYETLGRIDAGGMGVVWRVRDLQFGRDLALKVMAPRGRASARLSERFTSEARICAQLTHPFIVPVHTMSRLSDGRPYYTMKLVEGRTLAALLEGGAAPAGRRMEFVQLFNKVCQAVAFAHGRGVIHRDLKPGNIMVGAHGEVQLMDWGLAKVLAEPGFGSLPGEKSESVGGDSEDTEGSRTRVGSVLGTTAYMAPEQAQGRVEEVDRQSDVFALGGILCRILTGEPPYTGADAETIRKRAAEADLEVALARLHGCGADPELIRLAERCLAPRKADRPADAGEVAAEVTAYVSGVEERWQQERLRREREQVQAAEERRRRRLWMGLAASVLVVLCLLTAGLLVVNHLRHEEQKAKNLAQQREQETRTVMDDLSSTVIDDWLARQPRLTAEQKEFLKKGLAYYENFIQDTGQSPEGRAALAQAHRRVGTIRRQLGLLPEAEAALSRAVELLEELADEFPTDPVPRYRAARALETLAMICKERGDYRKAAPLVDEAIHHQQEAIRQHPGDAKDRASLGNLHHLLGVLRMDLRQWDEAETALRQALPILKELVEADPTEAAYRDKLAALHRTRGILFENQDKHEKAEPCFHQALPILKKLVADFPHASEYKLQLAGGHINLSVTLAKENRLREAEDALREAVAVLKTLVADFPSIPRYRHDLASGYNNLAIVLEDQERLDEAEAALRQAIALREKLAKDYPDVLDHAVTLASNYDNLAGLIRDQGRAADSLEWSDKAERILEPIVAREGRHDFPRKYLCGNHAGRARALDRLGRHAEAVRDWERAIALDDGKRRRFYESRRALSLGKHAQAVALTREQAQAKDVSDRTLYECAHTCALAAAAVPDDSVLRERYADDAVEFLRRAVAAGYSGDSHPRPWEDEAFHSLRGREEVQKLLKEMETRMSARK